MAFWKRKPKKQTAFVTAQLNARLQPLDRGRFEDPLNEFLSASDLGEVTGGGTQLADEPYGIEYCDVEIELTDLSPASIAGVIGELEKLGAPKGSKLHIPNGDSVPFGQYEGMAVLLDGVGLPDEVYKECDVDHLISEADRLLAAVQAGEFWSHWQGSKETVLFFYGPSFEDMTAAVSPLLKEYPLCAGARVEQIA
jgi:hypothetical protein